MHPTSRTNTDDSPAASQETTVSNIAATMSPELQNLLTDEGQEKEDDQEQQNG